MGLGSTTKKIQMLAERAEQLYARLNEVQEEMVHLRENLDETHDSVTTLKHHSRENRALLEAIAEEQGVDVDAVLTEAAIDEVDADADDGTPDGEGEGGVADTPQTDGGDV
jgi:uncharacterized coiled-coil DUF342 family protein